MLVLQWFNDIFYASRTSYCSYFLTITQSSHETSILNTAVLASPVRNLFLNPSQDFYFDLVYYISMWRVVYFFPQLQVMYNLHYIILP